jgi:hypothetical protein
MNSERGSQSFRKLGRAQGDPFGERAAQTEALRSSDAAGFSGCSAALAVAKMFCEGCHSGFCLVMATYKNNVGAVQLEITAGLDRNCWQTGVSAIAGLVIDGN